MRQPPSRLGAIVAAVALLAGALAAEQPISLYVTVTRGEHLILGLGAENFRVLVDGKPVAFRLEPPERPISIALLAEHSRASAPLLGDVANAIQSLMQAAPEAGDDWYALATFANRMTVAEDFTKLKGKIPAAFAALGPPQGSEIATYDALHEMLAKLERLPGRRVLVFIGSGLNSFGGRNLDEVRRQVAASNVTIFCIATGQQMRMRAGSRMNWLSADNLLRAIAKESGGEAWFPRFDNAFPDAARAIVQVLDHQYRLVLAPAMATAKHNAKVQVEAFAVHQGRKENYKVLAPASVAVGGGTARSSDGD